MSLTLEEVRKLSLVSGNMGDYMSPLYISLLSRPARQKREEIVFFYQNNKKGSRLYYFILAQQQYTWYDRRMDRVQWSWYVPLANLYAVPVIWHTYNYDI